MALDHFTVSFRVDLDALMQRPVNVTQVVVGPTGFIGAPDDAVVNYIRSQFANRPKPDLIVTVAGPAARFARAHRAQLFPDVPLLFASVDRRFLADAPLAANETAVAAVVDVAASIEEILGLLPDTRQVLMVTGSGPLGRFWQDEFHKELARFDGRVAFIWTNDLSLSELVARASALPDRSAIFYVLFATDASGTAYADERVLAELRAKASAPLFGLQSAYLGAGVVGGAALSSAELSRRAADAAAQLLNGAAPASIRIPPLPGGPPTFDARELRRWNIDEARLPPGSTVLFRPESLWSRYRLQILLAATALVAQSVLIVGLLYQRRARQRAELQSRRHLALAADASRRQTMAALTNSLTHDLGQPLSSMIQNAKALQLMIRADRATPEVAGEILSDIQAQGTQAALIIDRHRGMLQSRELDRKPIDPQTVVRESLALVAHDLRSRGIDAAAELSRASCIVSGDQVLLRQVLVNLMINAADAMVDTPPGKRRMTITSEVQGRSVRIAVRDSGPGLPSELDGQLFAPFATTKANGLGIGLTIVKVIVEAHGGGIEAGNHPGGGAVFTLTLPCSEAPA